jgi:hypothetical protein
VTALADLLSPRERQLLAERLAELKALDHLVRAVPDQQPAAEPPTLMEMATTERTTAS